MNNKLLGWSGRFYWSILSLGGNCDLFLLLQDTLPEFSRIALDFFRPYRFGWRAILSEAIRGIVMAVVLYPFYDLIIKESRGGLILFGALWGLAVFGSIEPMPGSFEGIVYTKTTFAEHLMVLAAAAVQSTAVFYSVSSVGEKGVGVPMKIKLPGYIGRFTFLYVLVYTIVGMVCYQLFGYEEALATLEHFELFRPLESPAMAGMVFAGAVIRGAILALLLYPFFPVILKKKHGWLLLFTVFFGLTTFGSLIFLHNLLDIEALRQAGSVREALNDLRYGVPEIFLQMLVFSWIFLRWERKRSVKANVSV